MFYLVGELDFEIRTLNLIAPLRFSLHVKQPCFLPLKRQKPNSVQDVSHDYTMYDTYNAYNQWQNICLNKNEAIVVPLKSSTIHIEWYSACLAACLFEVRQIIQCWLQGEQERKEEKDEEYEEEGKGSMVWLVAFPVPMSRVYGIFKGSFLPSLTSVTEVQMGYLLFYILAERFCHWL